jgi:tetrahydromethanopterin S-methyltransferase subunit F
VVDVHRCPGCSASVRPDAQWCSLCYRDLRSAPEQIPAQRTTHAPVGPRLGTTTARLTSGSTVAGTTGWPCTICSSLVPLDVDACPDCGSSFLARLAGDAGRHRSQDRKAGTDALRTLPRSARLIAGLVLGVLFAVLVPVLLALVG